MKEPKDKRTKAYKEWKKNFDAEQENKSKGLGDDIEKITEATGIKKLVKFIAGEDCGCDERKEKLNKIFRHNKLECLTEDEYNYLTVLFAKNKNVLNNEEVKKLYEISNRIFNKKNKPSSCSSCVRTTVLRLKKVVDAYK
jgi:DNA-directed RNA polymerase subunit F